MSERAERLRAALERDPGVDLHGADIEITESDDVIVLTGTVGHIADKKIAARRAHELLDNGAFLDRLRLRTGAQRPDDEIRDGVIEALRREPVFANIDVATGDASDVDVDVRDGAVRLTGQLISLSHRRLAEVIAWWQPGVARVDNRIQVEPPERDSDDEIRDAIMLVLEKDPTIDASQLSVEVRDAKVTLRGGVINRDQGQRAVKDCWYVAGVHAVTDETDVVNVEEGSR